MRRLIEELEAKASDLFAEDGALKPVKRLAGCLAEGLGDVHPHDGDVRDRRERQAAGRRLHEGRDLRRSGEAHRAPRAATSTSRLSRRRSASASKTRSSCSSSRSAATSSGRASERTRTIEHQPARRRLRGRNPKVTHMNADPQAQARQGIELHRAQERVEVQRAAIVSIRRASRRFVSLPVHTAPVYLCFRSRTPTQRFSTFPGVRSTVTMSAGGHRSKKTARQKGLFTCYLAGGLDRFSHRRCRSIWGSMTSLVRALVGKGVTGGVEAIIRLRRGAGVAPAGRSGWQP